MSKLKTASPIKKYNIVFNPFTREIGVLYMGFLKTYVFTELDEWYGFEKEENSERWLNIHLDYDESLSLNVYPCVKETTFYSLGAGWDSNKSNRSSKIKVVYSDADFKKAISLLEDKVTSYSDYRNSLVM